MPYAPISCSTLRSHLAGWHAASVLGMQEAGRRRTERKRQFCIVLAARSFLARAGRQLRPVARDLEPSAARSLHMRVHPPGPAWTLEGTVCRSVAVNGAQWQCKSRPTVSMLESYYSSDLTNRVKLQGRKYSTVSAQPNAHQAH